MELTLGDPHVRRLNLTQSFFYSWGSGSHVGCACAPVKRLFIKLYTRFVNVRPVFYGFDVGKERVIDLRVAVDDNVDKGRQRVTAHTGPHQVMVLVGGA